MKIVFASSNKGKIIELRDLLHNTSIDIVPQSELNVEDVVETGITFVENAILKARHASKITGLPAIADDSGLCVNALNGAPGIFSARFAGKKAASEDNIKKLLHEMKSVPEEKRKAQFYCALVFLHHAEDPTPLICEGVWQGSVLFSPAGEKGFGYDPIFFDPKEKMSAAELPLTRKNQISHRAQALQALLQNMRSV